MAGPLEYRDPALDVPARNMPVRIVVGAILGTVTGAVICLLLWIFVGGWGPPMPFLPGVGLTTGIVAAFAEPAKRRRK
jgi:hypothetical protein